MALNQREIADKTPILFMHVCHFCDSLFDVTDLHKWLVNFRLLSVPTEI